MEGLNRLNGYTDAKLGSVEDRNRYIENNVAQLP